MSIKTPITANIIFSIIYVPYLYNKECERADFRPSRAYFLGLTKINEPAQYAHGKTDNRDQEHEQKEFVPLSGDYTYKGTNPSNNGCNNTGNCREQCSHSCYSWSRVHTLHLFLSKDSI